jgi:hypothetical protein
LFENFGGMVCFLVVRRRGVRSSYFGFWGLYGFFCFVFLSYFAGQKVWEAVSRGFLPGRVALMKGRVWIGSDGVRIVFSGSESLSCSCIKKEGEEFYRVSPACVFCLSSIVGTLSVWVLMDYKPYQSSVGNCQTMTVI